MQPSSLCGEPQFLCLTFNLSMELKLARIRLSESLVDGPELLKVEDVQTHICAKFPRTCAKCVLLNAK